MNDVPYGPAEVLVRAAESSGTRATDGTPRAGQSCSTPEEAGTRLEFASCM
jgi:hypothetical protein